MEIKNEIKDILDKFYGFNTETIVKALTAYVEQSLKSKESELDAFAMNKAADVKYYSKLLIDNLISEYHRKELMSDSNTVQIPLAEVIEDLKWLNTEILETK